MLKLETPRLSLRTFRPDDVAVFAAYRSDPEVARYQSWDAPFPVEAAICFVDQMIHQAVAEPGSWYQLAIERKADGRMIGDCALHFVAEQPRQAEIGFTLDRLAQRQGYAAEAVERVLAYLFAELDFHRVVGLCDVENERSARLLERVGMRREAHFVENFWHKGRWTSEYLYAVLQREWRTRQAEQTSP